MSWSRYTVITLSLYQNSTPPCGHSAFGAGGAKALMFLDSSGVKWNFSIKGHRTQTIICHEFCWTFAALKCLNWSNIWIMEFQDLLFHFLWIMSSFWRLFFYVFMGKIYMYIFNSFSRFRTKKLPKIKEKKNLKNWKVFSLD